MATVKEGDRVRLIRFSTENTKYDDNQLVPPGTEGTVGSIDDAGTIHVHWDNGRHLGLLPVDEWVLLCKYTTTLNGETFCNTSPSQRCEVHDRENGE